LQQSLKRDRVFSVSQNFLASAIVDLRLHMLADGSEIDPMEVERQVLEELALHPANDLTLYLPHAFHTFTQQYAAGVYTYLWSDVIAADAAEAFLETPGGFFDDDVAKRWRETILEVGNTLPTADAYRNFRGRDPDPMALMRRFDLLQ